MDLKCTMSVYSTFFLVWSLSNMVLFFYTARKICISAYLYLYQDQGNYITWAALTFRENQTQKIKCHRLIYILHIFYIT